MLTLDPKQRITAEEALRHRYFQEDPPPQIPSMMPTFPSRAEGGRSVDLCIVNFNQSDFLLLFSIKKRTFEDYMSGQVAETEGGLLNDSLYTSTSFQLKFA
jgi:D-alanyl-D-alanine dipeptidase